MKWRIGPHLGAGASSSVYRVDHAEAPVGYPPRAAKLLHAAAAADEAARERLAHEAALLANLAHTDLVVRVHEAVLLDGHPAILMELLEGTDLSELPRPLPEEVVWSVLRRVATALDLLWNAPAGTGKPPLRLIHGDLKLQNVFLTRLGGVRLLDFGLSRAAAEGAHRGEGTYLAPEQLGAGATLSAAVDIFALGVIGAMLCTTATYTVVPAHEEGASVWRRAWSERLQGTAPALRGLIERCLSWAPGERPSAQQVAQQAAHHVPDTEAALCTCAVDLVEPLLRTMVPKSGPWTGKVVRSAPLHTASIPPNGSAGPNPPGCDYDPNDYVHRPQIAEVRRRMGHRGEPITVTGPWGCGKTWLLKHALREEISSRTVLWLNLKDEGAKNASPLQRVTEAAARALEVEVPDLPPFRALSQLLEKQLLPRGATGTLVLDDADASHLRDVRDELFGGLRALCERDRPPWDRFRLALGVSSDPSALITSPHISPFALSAPINLKHFRGVTELAQLHGLELSDDDRALLRRWLPDNVHLLRIALYEAANSGEPLARVFERAFTEGLFGRELLLVWQAVHQLPAVAALVRALLNGEPYPRDYPTYDRLHAMGVLSMTPEFEITFSCELYRSFFRAFPP